MRRSRAIFRAIDSIELPAMAVTLIDLKPSIQVQGAPINRKNKAFNTGNLKFPRNSEFKQLIHRSSRFHRRFSVVSSSESSPGLSEGVEKTGEDIESVKSAISSLLEGLFLR